MLFCFLACQILIEHCKTHRQIFPRQKMHSPDLRFVIPDYLTAHINPYESNDNKLFVTIRENNVSIFS